MVLLRNIILAIIILPAVFLVWHWYEDVDKTVIQFFPINQKITFTDLGSNLNTFKQGDNYVVKAESWSKTNQKVYLRQDVNLLFRNGLLISMVYPWKENTDWLYNKMEEPLQKDSIYLMLTYHHAEIHQDDIITSNQAVTADKLYVTYFQNMWEAFKTPENARQKEAEDLLEQTYYNQRKSLLEKGIKELNINQTNYEIYDLDTFSLKKQAPKAIPEEEWDKVLGGLWEGLYRSYVLAFSKDELKYFSPPLPWVLVDNNGTHLLVLFQRANGLFEKLLLQI